MLQYLSFPNLAQITRRIYRPLQQRTSRTEHPNIASTSNRLISALILFIVLHPFFHELMLFQFTNIRRTTLEGFYPGIDPYFPLSIDFTKAWIDSSAIMFILWMASADL